MPESAARRSRRGRHGRRWPGHRRGRAAAVARSRRAPARSVRRRPTAADAAAHGATRDRRAVRAVPGRRVGRRRPTPATPTRPSAGPRRSPRSRSTSTPARSRSRRSSPRTTSAGPSTRSWPRARSRAARCRPSATRRSRRSSCDDGRYLNDRLANYLIPTALDAPPITTILVEEPFAGGRTARRASASCRWTSAAPAVVAAIHDATGVWIHELPATPERILAALGGASTAARSPGRRAIGVTRRGVSAHRVQPSTGAPVEVGVPGMRRLLDVLREDLGPDRHQGGLRRRRVRRLLGAARRRPS